MIKINHNPLIDLELQNNIEDKILFKTQPEIKNHSIP